MAVANREKKKNWAAHGSKYNKYQGRGADRNFILGKIRVPFFFFFGS